MDQSVIEEMVAFLEKHHRECKDGCPGFYRPEKCFCGAVEADELIDRIRRQQREDWLNAVVFPDRKASHGN